MSLDTRERLSNGVKSIAVLGRHPMVVYGGLVGCQLGSLHWAAPQLAARPSSCERLCRTAVELWP